MPSYRVKPEENYPCEVSAAPKKKQKRYPRVYIPASPEIIAALEVGQAVSVQLQGKVVGLESRQTTDDYGNRCEFQVELRLVDADPGEEADDDEPDEPDMKDAIDKGLGYSK